MHPSPLEWVASGVCPWMCSQTRLVPSICGVKIGKKSVGCVYCSSTMDGLAHPRTSVWPSRLVGDLPGLARAPLQGVKKPITHLSPKSIAVSAPLCRNYFCCHVRARVSPGGGKALSQQWEERRDVPPRDGSAAQRDADPHRAAASRLLLSLLCCECLKHFWRRGGLLIKPHFVEQLTPCNCLFPVPVSKCLLFSQCFTWSSTDRRESFSPANAICRISTAVQILSGGKPSPAQLLCVLQTRCLCSAGRRLPVTSGFCAASVSEIGRAHV